MNQIRFEAARGSEELTCFLGGGDGGTLEAVLQLSVKADLVARVGRQVGEAVTAGASAQPQLLLLTI